MAHDDLMPSTLDREISRSDQDAFGHRHFAQALRSLIESREHITPFSIGLLGGWGTGKSSIKQLYATELEEDEQRSDGLKRRQRFHCITFNAWRFGGKDQDIKRALLRHVFLELGGTEENLQDKLFRQISEVSQVPKPWLTVMVDQLKAWALPIPALLVVLGTLLLVCYLAFAVFKVESAILRAVIFTCITGTYTYVLKHLKPSVVSTSRPVTRVALPSTTSEQYEDMLLDQIRLYKAGKAESPEGRKGKTCERLIVFVDDLDRLSADEMVAGLDAVRTFMEIPKSRLPDGLGLVFVISCDEAKVADALARGRRNADLPATVFNHFDARRFLDRIFQFRLEIPPPPRQDMRAFATKHLESLTTISEDLKARGTQLAPIIDRMIHVGVQDPRNALQIVNAFAQAWWIAKKRELEGLGTDRPGGLHEGAVTTHPISLGALCALRVSFPDFYQDLQSDPGFLQCFTDVVIRGRSLKDQPLASQQLLMDRYLRSPIDEGKIEIRPEHRPLRQYVASLAGLRWPNSLQSLLLLSEDPVTRRLGGKAGSIYAAFVSGDSQGVLEGMGRHNDMLPLHLHEARTLYQMFENLEQESPSRRTNAARVIADLIERVPEPPAQQLLSVLCREIADTADLRSQLGANRLAKLLAQAAGVDQVAVASRLVSDLLTPGRGVQLRLESLETPSLEEAVEMVRNAVPLVLSVRDQYGLEAHTDSMLIEWLVDRTVSANGKSFQLPFDELEGWLKSANSELSADLGLRYLHALADELAKDNPASFDVGFAVARSKSIFMDCMPVGVETRKELWALLQQYVGLPQPEAVRIAWEVAASQLDKAEGEAISAFVLAFVNRLKASVDDWEEVDKADAAAHLLAVASARSNSLNDSALSSVASLAEAWTNDPELAESSCKLVETVRVADAALASKTLDGWATRILTTLPAECIKYLASSFKSLAESSQAAAVSALAYIVNTEAISQDVKQRYENFVKNVPRASWGQPPLKGHLDARACQKFCV
ncbi:KAP family P-loop NTPase fold protein [Cupriavidus necator]|nr:P-loop NTPase fold protein [Cupriavidus necator]